MKIQDLLKTTEHRPWKIPTENWKFYQEWNNAIFLHWEVELEELKKFVPKELEMDLFEGKPWVSVVAFTMEKIRPKYFPSLSAVSDFDEINIRTYVKSGSKTGVYFLSIEGGKRFSCKIAKAISELPYRYSKIKRTANQYQSYNAAFNDKLDVRFSIGETLKTKSELDRWLTERYALFQDTKQAINAFEIHHLEWPIHHINITAIDFNYQRFKNLLKNEPNKVQYSKGVNVVAWGKTKKDKTSYNKV
ncbi:YqjF family protein [Winogradskyella sp.]|uniref:YqjF family protein n=1 Tax=Winogradskyella sp. TaxID=1883156 RepID=UPI003AB4FF40